MRFKKGALEKGYLHKLVWNRHSNLRQICDNFAHPACGVQNEIPVILHKFGAQFATNLRNAPFANAPFSGFLWAVILQRRFSVDFAISRFKSSFFQPCYEFGVAILVSGVYFCLPSGLGVRNLFSYQLVRLKTCLSLAFLRSGCHALGVS